MGTPLTLGMSSLLFFRDETFEYPALENDARPDTKKNYGGYNFSQRDLEAASRLLNSYDTPHIQPSHKTKDCGGAARASTPALPPGSSAINSKSSSTSQASPLIAPDYFSRPRQPNSDGSTVHFNTVNPAENNDYSEFRNAINKRFNHAREVLSAQRNSFDNDFKRALPATQDLMDFLVSDFQAQQQSEVYRHSELDASLKSVAPGSKFGLQSRSHPELDPEPGAGPNAPGSVILQQRHSPPPSPPNIIASQPTQPPPIKRRRRRKAPPSAEVKAQKHKAFLERNREAASKCRTKKKSQIQKLEEVERDGRALNQMLKDEFKGVLGEVLLLREQVKLRDMACGGECARKYWAKTDGEGKKQTGGDQMEGVEHDGLEGYRDKENKVKLQSASE